MNGAILIDIDALKSTRTVMKQKFQRIIEYYFEDTAVYLDAIADGLQKADATMIVPAAHTIKSSSRQLGAVVLANAAADLEMAAKAVVKGEKNFDTLVNQAGSLRGIFDNTKTQMEVALEEVVYK